MKAVFHALLLVVLTACEPVVGPTDHLEAPAPTGGQTATLEFDLAGINQITKVSYEFVNDSDSIGSEVVPEGARFTITLPVLLGKTWKTSLVVWTQSSKLYRYQDNLTFDGEVQVLPPPGLALSKPAGGWAPLFHKKAGSADVLVSADPFESYTVEIHLPKGSYVHEAFADREIDRIVGTQLFFDNFEFFELTEGPFDTIVVPFPDRARAEATSYRVTSVVIFVFGPEGGRVEDAESFGDLFLWTLEDGVLTP